MGETEAFDYIDQVVIGGLTTDIMCHKFRNRIFLVVTQYGKIANIVTVKNQAYNGAATNKQKVYEIQPNFGTVTDETQGAIRFLMNTLQKDNLVISLALKKINKDILVELRDVLTKIKCLK